MQIEVLKTSDLTPYARNARTHSEAQVSQIAASIKEFGFNNPVLIDETGNIIAGHGRVLAAQKLALKEVPCIRLSHLSPTQRKAYVLADNRLALNAGWDEAMLSLELAELKEADFDLALIGFDEMELEKLTAPSKNEGLTDPDEVPEAPEEPVTKLGDIWKLGRHRLMCGDSTDKATVEKLMNGQKARFVFTDPPWNVDYGSDTRHPSWKPRQILNDRMSTEEFGAFLLRAFNCMREVSEAGCMTYVVMSAQEWGNVMNALREAGYHWSSTIIWKKDSLVLSRKDYHTQYEPIWYGWLEGTRLCPLKDRKQSDVWEIPRPKVSEEHPTMKPVSLVAKAILNSSHAGDLVLDLFGGSGTTMIAAEQTGRICFMMELDPKYCDVIVKRWEDYTGRKAELVNAR